MGRTRLVLIGCTRELEAMLAERVGNKVEVVCGREGLLSGERLGTAVVVLGPDVEQPTHVTQKVHLDHPAARILIVADESRAPLLRQTLQMSPIVPTSTRVLSANDPESVSAAVLSACRRKDAGDTQGESARDSSLPASGTWEHSSPKELNSVVRELQARNRLLAAIVESSADAIFATDLAGNIKTWNAAAERLYEFSVDDAVGGSINLITPESERESTSARLSSLKAEGFGRRFEAQRATKTGRQLTVSVAMSPIVNDDAEVVGVAWGERDITEQKRAELALMEHHLTLERRVRERTQELQQTADQLLKSNRELSDFAYIASHDLKEPLRGIANYSNFLLEDYENVLDDEGRSKLLTLIYLTQRMTMLIEALLDYSRLTSQPLDVDEVDVTSLVEESARALQSGYEDVQFRLQRPLPTTYGNAIRLGQVFHNLMSNAAKYNDKSEKWIEVGAVADPLGRPMYFVRDNGIGIPKQHHSVIFRIFKRLHGRSQFGGGVGAGLTIVKKIVEAHEGALWLDSTPGEGTTFWFAIGYTPLDEAVTRTTTSIAPA